MSFSDLLPFQLNNYEFLKFIGSGSFSEAYLVRSIQYDVNYCAKVSPIDPALIDEDGNLREPELYALLNLDHPNVIRLFQFFLTPTHIFLILELCSSNSIENCDETTDRSGFHRLNYVNSSQESSYYHMPNERLKYICFSLVSALKYCHSQNIAHRDIKPSNILFDSYNRLKLADFGLSAFFASSQKSNSSANSTNSNASNNSTNSNCSNININKCLTNIVCGSGSFLAPEMILNEDNKLFDPFKADVWAMGVTIYQMATGRLPWPECEDRYTAYEMRKTLKILNGLQDNDNDYYVNDSLLTECIENNYNNDQQNNNPYFKTEIRQKNHVNYILDQNFWNLISKMLTFDPEKRPTMEMLQDDPYIKSYKKNNLIKMMNPLSHGKSIGVTQSANFAMSPTSSNANTNSNTKATMSASNHASTGFGFGNTGMNENGAKHIMNAMMKKKGHHTHMTHSCTTQQQTTKLPHTRSQRFSIPSAVIMRPRMRAANTQNLAIKTVL